MELGTSRDDLICFLKCQVEDGQIPINTGLSRVASVRKVLGVLSDAEAEDVTNLDVDSVLRRFIAQADHQYSIASRVSYRSRLKSALDDFNSARASPKQGLQEGAKAVGPRARTVQTGQTVRVPLARGGTVLIENLPIDLTRIEAERISNVIHAYVMADE